MKKDVDGHFILRNTMEGFFPFLRRGTAVFFMKHAAEQFIIGEAMAGQDVHDAVAGTEKILTDVGKTNLIDVFQEGDSHIFFKISAEIFWA